MKTTKVEMNQGFWNWFKKPRKGVHHMEITATPKRAAEFLKKERLAKNPRGKIARSKSYAVDMENGNWSNDNFAGPLVFQINEQGEWFLLDGGNRLRAVVASKQTVTFQAVILEHYIDTNTDLYDTGSPRTLAQALKRMNVAQPTLTAAVTKLLVHQTQGPQHAISISQCLNFYAKYENAISFVILLTSQSSRSGIKANNVPYKASLVRALHHMTPPRVMVFHDVVSTGVCSSKKDQAAAKLREYYVENPAEFARGGSSGHAKWALFCENALAAFRDEAPLLRVLPVDKIGNKLPLPGEAPIANLAQRLQNIKDAKDALLHEQVICTDSDGNSLPLNLTTRRGRITLVLAEAAKRDERLTETVIQQRANRISGSVLEGRDVSKTLYQLKKVFPSNFENLGHGVWRYNYAR